MAVVTMQNFLLGFVYKLKTQPITNGKKVLQNNNISKDCSRPSNRAWVDFLIANHWCKWIETS